MFGLVRQWAASATWPGPGRPAWPVSTHAPGRQPHRWPIRLRPRRADGAAQVRPQSSSRFGAGIPPNCCPPFRRRRFGCRGPPRQIRGACSGNRSRTCRAQNGPGVTYHRHSRWLDEGPPKGAWVASKRAQARSLCRAALADQNRPLLSRGLVGSVRRDAPARPAEGWRVQAGPRLIRGGRSRHPTVARKGDGCFAASLGDGTERAHSPTYGSSHTSRTLWNTTAPRHRSVHHSREVRRPKDRSGAGPHSSKSRESTALPGLCRNST